MLKTNMHENIGQVRVWKFTVFELSGPRDLPSSRYARQETISTMGGAPVRGSDIVVKPSDLDDMGMTMPGFVATKSS